MKIEFKFYSCCSARFKMVYGKLMRSVRRQVGKKKFSDLSITGQEFLVDIHLTKKHSNRYNRFGYYLEPGVCKTCMKFRTERNQSKFQISKYEVKIEG